MIQHVFILLLGNKHSYTYFLVQKTLRHHSKSALHSINSLESQNLHYLSSPPWHPSLWPTSRVGPRRSPTTVTKPLAESGTMLEGASSLQDAAKGSLLVSGEQQWERGMRSGRIENREEKIMSSERGNKQMGKMRWVEEWDRFLLTFLLTYMWLIST